MPTYLFSFLALISLLSCSTLWRPRPEWIVSSVPLETSAAKSLLKSKKLFLELTFEQMRDLNYNTPKFQSSCLGANIPGEISEDPQAIFLRSELMTDKDFHVGLCPGQSGSQSAHFVWLYCRRSKQFFEIRCLLKDCDGFPWVKLC